MLGYSCLTNDILSLTDGVLSSSWLKAKNGLKKFAAIVEGNNSEDTFIENLLTVLEDTTK